jgi:glycosyltransferase involved in cell wall biosynthesis
MDKISAVLCVRNSAKHLNSTILTLAREGITGNRMIVVDGQSSDGSREIASELDCLVVSDEGLGFTHARAFGSKLVQTPLTLVVGPDDILEEGSLAILAEYLHQNPKCAGVQLSKTVRVGLPTFWDHGMGRYYSHLPTGIVPVIGTPALFRTELLQQNEYDSGLTNDDTDWCFRVMDLGFYFFRTPRALSREVSSLSWREYSRRWAWYGRGDFDFIEKHWSINRTRAIKHLFHPAREYMVRLFMLELAQLEFRGAFFMSMSGILRYWGMFTRLTEKLGA